MIRDELCTIIEDELATAHGGLFAALRLGDSASGATLRAVAAAVTRAANAADALDYLDRRLGRLGFAANAAEVAADAESCRPTIEAMLR